MYLMKPLTFALDSRTGILHAGDLPRPHFRVHRPPLTEKPDDLPALSGPSAQDNATNAFPDLRMDIPYQWTGCHGEGRMTFLADSTMTGTSTVNLRFALPVGSKNAERLYPGCGGDCEDMIAYRFDDTEKAWRQWDAACWYEPEARRPERSECTPPAATVSRVPGSTRMKDPVARLRR